jgi:RNA polymerase sigma-70 factor (ECF subfamily)
MLIHYKGADGRTIDLEVTEEVGNFYLSSLDEEKKNDRRETRRHTHLSEFTHEDARFFDSGTDICGEFATSDAVKRTFDRMTARERFLIISVHLEGYTYTEIAKAEVKYPSTIMRETNKATEKFRRLYSEGE